MLRGRRFSYGVAHRYRLGESSHQSPVHAPHCPFHSDHRADDDHHTQQGALFRLMTPAEQQRLFDNTARSFGGTSLPVQQRHIAHCSRADPAYGRGVALALERLGHTPS